MDDPKAAGQGGGEEPAKKETPAKAATRDDPLRLYPQFFGFSSEGMSASEGAPDPPLLSAIKKHAKDQGYSLDFTIALVPDPVDSNLAESFDQVLDALQAGYIESGYLLDSLWLPWTESAGEAKSYREIPGLLLFRQPNRRGTDRKLAGVFLVGETPKKGIQKGALLTALELVKGLREDKDKGEVKILGPFFSGSAESLAINLAPLSKDPAEPSDIRRRNALAGLTFRIVTGSATAARLEEHLPPPLKLERTVIPDNVLQRSALLFLKEKLGWKENEVALLAESDTQYGKSYQALQEDSNFTLATFPSGVSDIRTAWEKDGKFRNPEDEEAPIKLRKLTLDLSLADPTKPVDIVPELSSLSVRTHDLQISNLLTAISRDEIRYLGILATDVRDTLFLAKRIREYAPDIILFTFDNHLLHAHPQFVGDTDGMLVISNFPLFTEGDASRALLGGPKTPGGDAGGGPSKRFRRQFTSDFQEGILRATRRLLREKEPVEESRVWIAAVGSGTLWPIAALPVTASDLSRTSGIPASKPARRPSFELSSKKSTLQTSLLLLSLFLFAWLLQRSAPPVESDPTTERLLTLGYSLLLLSAEVLILACSIRLWHGWYPGPFYLPVCCGALLLCAAILRQSRFELSGEKRRLLIILGVLLILSPSLALALDRYWMPGGAQFFDLRVRKLSSGLSPLVSLGYFAASLYTWILLELKRRRLILRQVIPWPLQQPCEDVLLDCSELSEELDTRLHRTLPPFKSVPPLKKSRFWWVLALGTIPTGIYLLLTLQPICETREYGWFFLLLLLVCVSLSAISFAQFLKLWLLLDARILRRLDHSSLIAAFQRIYKEVGWEPMRSFGWQMPTFKMLTLSIEKLNVAYRALSESEDPNTALKKIFEADKAGKLHEEIAARKELEDRFTAIYGRLAEHRDHPAVEDFFAVRIVAYLRPVVAHMRNCLMAALISGFLTLLAVRTYAFEPKQFASVGLWLALIVAVTVTIWVFIQMDRNPTLSAIAGTDAGKVSFDRNFVINLATYGLIPLLGLIVSQFPQVSRFVGAWFNPLLRIVGAG